MINIYTDKELLEIIGERIRLKRESEKLSQEDLGKQIGLTRQSISNIEKGKNGSLLYFVRILRYFDLEDGLINLFPEDGKTIDPYDYE